jgi:hypothetical protein
MLQHLSVYFTAVVSIVYSICQYILQQLSVYVTADGILISLPCKVRFVALVIFGHFWKYVNIN